MDTRSILPPQQSRIGADSKYVIRTILRGGVGARLIPVFEKILHWYVIESDSARDDMQMAAWHASADRKVAGDFVDAVNRMAYCAESLRRAIGDASLKRRDESLPLVSELVELLGRISPHADALARSSSEKDRKPRGRPPSPRVMLAWAVVHVFRLRGVPVAKSRDGHLARVLVLYPAVGIDAPMDMFKDVRKAIALADRDPVDPTCLRRWGMSESRIGRPAPPARPRPDPASRPTSARRPSHSAKIPR